jgi:hypothetical protein
MIDQPRHQPTPLSHEYSALMRRATPNNFKRMDLADLPGASLQL